MTEGKLSLPDKPRKAPRKDPWVLTLYGPAKVGKTQILSELEGCLIMDTEKGAEFVDGLIVQPKNLADFNHLIKELKARKAEYDYIALDTIDMLVNWIEKSVCKANEVGVIGDIPYGAGYDAVRTTTMKYMYALKGLTKRFIQIGHRKKTIIGTDKVEVSADSLDLTGKLRNMILADSDAVGFLYRGENDELMVSFEGKKDSVDAGSRCSHLRNKSFPFSWDKIYID